MDNFEKMKLVRRLIQIELLYSTERGATQEEWEEAKSISKLLWPEES